MVRKVWMLGPSELRKASWADYADADALREREKTSAQSAKSESRQKRRDVMLREAEASRTAWPARA